MPCIEQRRLACAAAVVAGCCLGGCAVRVAPPAVPAPAPVPSVAPVPAPPQAPPAPAAAAPPLSPLLTTPAPPRVPKLDPPVAARNWEEFKQQAARRLLAANPEGTYGGAVPEPLLAIPVLEVELNADGSVRRVHVLRQPSQARDTTQLAIDAVHRAAPYGSMAKLPLPWKWAEVFLFDESRRFKPRTLD